MSVESSTTTISKVATDQNNNSKEHPRPLQSSFLVQHQLPSEIRSSLRFPDDPPLCKTPVISSTDAPYRNLFQFLLCGPSNPPLVPIRGKRRQFNSESLDKQLDLFIQSQQLSPSEQLTRWQVTLDLLAILRKAYPHCELAVFGSLLTGLADPGSDVDISLATHGLQLPDPANLSKQDMISLALEVERILRKAKSPMPDSCAFAEKMHIIPARVPLVQLTQLRTGIKMDLSFGNWMAVQNSKLIQFYLDYDVRVKHLIIFLRYWAKFHGLSGSDKIKQYVINLLALVYLATEGIVPQIMLLQNLWDHQQKTMESNCWNANFSTDLSLINKHFKPSTKYHPSRLKYASFQSKYFLQMVEGFFEMVGNIRFEKMVVCPLFGTIIPRDSLERTGVQLMDNLPFGKLSEYRKAEWKRLVVRRDPGGKFYKKLTVQDPFQLDYNPGNTCRQNTLNRFLQVCKATRKILKKEPKSLLELLVKMENE